MANKEYKIWDPIHNFISLTAEEIDVLNSRPLQRLRHIHQLGLSHFIYPGANHTRFEHSLGVMELATRVFDVVTHPHHLAHLSTESLRELSERAEWARWRQELRMAALCHDLGHLPFSHAAEEELLPEGWKHEQLTKAIIESEQMRLMWDKFDPPLRPRQVARLAIGYKKYREERFTSWENILSEIIIGDAFGADRMDYLLRDSYHLGVPYGTFDHYRLIDTLRIVPQHPSDDIEPSKELTLGVEEGGLHCAENLLLARYFMFTQVYYHKVRCIYDIHLNDFLKQWDRLSDGKFPTDVDAHLDLTDNEVMGSMMKAAYDDTLDNHENARRIIRREHFRKIYSPTPTDVRDTRERVFKALSCKFGKENVREYHKLPEGEVQDFTVLVDGRPHSAMALTDVIRRTLGAKADYIFIHPDYLENAKALVDEMRK